jgi:4-hydroxythreonine-4-phosphate dehydrogenase
MKKPVIGITMGDPTGIGPELIIKALSKKEVYGSCRPFVIGDPNVMREAVKIVRANSQIKTIHDLSEAAFSSSHPDVLRPEGVKVEDLKMGKIDPAMGKVAALCLEKAFKMAMEKKVDGVISAPLNKEAFHLAGYNYSDELDYMAEITQSRGPFAIGVMDPIWTVTVTFHLPFREIADRIKKERILFYIRSMDRTLRKVGFSNPRIAVASLNVHGGEGGHFGREEIDEISPAVEEARSDNINVRGPFPADTIFARALGGEFDAVVCMYHDQANIARKLHARRRGATLFMGLPVPCGTTAHGTAFDIAGKGIADPGSMDDALKYIVMLSA